jgi:hypothetical protein
MARSDRVILVHGRDADRAEAIIDRVMPVHDAARAEHRVIDGTPSELFEIALHADLAGALHVNPLAGALFSLRAGIERVVALVTRRDAPAPVPEESLILADMPDRGQWVSLGKRPSEEIAFGVIGRFWAGETRWEEIDAADFADFSRPGVARIAANLSFRPYGRNQTLVSYECRVQATDPASRRAFMRYWRPVSPLIGVVLRSVLKLIDREQREGLRAGT